MAWPPLARPLGETLDVAGVGEAMLLLQATPPETVADASSMLVDVAGAELNMSAAVARLGGTAALLTRLGADSPGTRIRHAMSSLGIDTAMVTADDSRPTGLFLRETPPDGSRRVTYYRAGSAASAMDRSDAERLWTTPPRAVVLSGLTAALGTGPRELVTAIAEAAADHGTSVVVDVNLRQGFGDLDAVVAALGRVLPRTDLLVLGDDESEPVLGVTEPEAVFAAAREHGIGEVVLKGGPRGCWFQDDDGTPRHLPTRAVEVVDPVGAGDAFLGGYLAARLAGAPTGAAAELGSELAAGVIGAFGDTAGLPDPPAARAALAAAVQRGMRA
ncbi:2-dehydro-3-deoxygluconokinase [Georgenia halophila]|uniref:2-dehydro-3-deoxygluconokinase n=1 Tax=Georgenia halophila TaxID=620889 RepID=A0ABP8LLE9_9MICO